MNRIGIQGHDKGLPAFIMALFMAALLVFPGCSPGPDKATSFKTVFDHYRDREKITAISFPPGLVGLFLSKNNPEQAELKGLLQDLSSFHMLSVEEGAQDYSLAGELRSTVNDYTIRNHFQDLFRMQADGEDIFIRIKEKDGTIREAVLMFAAEDSFFVIDLRGNIDIQHFTRLAENGQLKSLINLTGLDL